MGLTVFGLMTEHHSVKRLRAHASIRIDRWGVPHIRADSQHDLFFVQGFNAARDRLWQIDLWRKRGLGLLAADFGPGYLAQDEASRLLLYRGEMDAEWAAYGEDTKAICTAFTCGINAYLELCEAEPERLPPEFTLFQTRPSMWRVEDVVRIRSHALTRNALSEIVRANVVRRSDAETDLLRRSLDPLVEPTSLPGIGLEVLPLEAVDLFKLGTASVTFEPARLSATLDEARLWCKVSALGDVLRDVENEGSNNWAVSGSLTASGRPILASDPHRAHAVPCLRYLVHLTMPGFNAIGASEPAIPGITLGHNGSLAFSLTIHGADQEDLCLHNTHPDDPKKYRWNDGWREFDEVEEIFPVKGHPPQKRVLKYAGFCPVLYENPERRLAVSLRSVWWEPGTAAYLGSLAGMNAKNIAAFSSTLCHWGAPSVNFVCADTAGSIGWFTAGRTPIRSGWNGLLPIPGDGQFEWQGFIGADELPRAIDPPEGFLATANEMNLPPDIVRKSLTIGHEWHDNSRADRIKQVLRLASGHDVAASCMLQNDTVSLIARRMIRIFEAEAGWQDVGPAGDVLVGWDGDLSVESAPALLFEVWWSLYLKPTLLTRLPKDPSLRGLLEPGDDTTIAALIEVPDERFGLEPTEGRNSILAETLLAAFNDCSRRFGPVVSQWAWGKLHHASFTHDASSVRGGDRSWDIGPMPLGGSGVTVMNARYRSTDFWCTTGASVRLVMDVGCWDESKWMNSPGQSGDPRSKHYNDLVHKWSVGEYIPMLYSSNSVDAETESIIELWPSKNEAV